MLLEEVEKYLETEKLEPVLKEVIETGTPAVLLDQKAVIIGGPVEPKVQTVAFDKVFPKDSGVTFTTVRRTSE